MYRVRFTETEHLPQHEGYFIENCKRKELVEDLFFETKQAAWEYFERSIGEYYGTKDFWIDIDWGDMAVETIHMDESGENHLILYKWENFNDDIELGWDYKDKIFSSYRELCKEYPEFAGCSVSDKPWIWPNNYKDGDDVAKLVYKAKWAR